MAQLTPKDILDMSEPLEQVYSEIVDQVMINIAKHFNTGESIGQAYMDWQIQKLAELGQVRAENLDIIQAHTKQAGVLAREALEETVRKALKDVDPQLKDAAEKGLLGMADADDPLLSSSISQALKSYYEQARQKMNLVNTTMLESSLAQYRKIVSDVIADEQTQKAQEILNETAGEVVTGVSSHQTAVRKAIKQFAEAGIKGFYDKSGRGWTPEAYVAMDIRTTVHNTAIQSVLLRNQDYGNNLIWTSAHDGARPLCYPWQAKVLSTDYTYGSTTDLNGKNIEYIPLEDTSYGEPAGLFGINCGHFANVFIPGVSVVNAKPQHKALNDAQYAESQRQRALERKVRYAKRDALIYKAAGDVEGFQNAAKKIKSAQADLNSFLEDTGRTPRQYRTQVNGFNRSISAQSRSFASGVEPNTKQVKADMAYQVERLTPEEKDALKSYTGFAATAINTELNTGKVNQQYTNLIPTIDSALSKCVVPDDITVYRCTTLSYVSESLKGLSVENIADIRYTLDGQVVSFPGYLSTSFKDLNLGARNVIMKLSIPKGYRGAAYIAPVSSSKYRTQDEVLIKRDSNIRVTSVSVKGSRIYIEGDVLNV